MKLKIDKTTLLRLLIFAGSIVLIFLTQPRERDTSLSYEVNKLWGYDDLVAPLDIPINVEPMRRAAIEDSLQRNFQPVYQRDAQVEKSVIDEYERLLEENTGLTAYERRKLVEGLSRVYAVGVMDPSRMGMAGGGVPTQIRMISEVDHRSDSRSTADFYTLRKAYVGMDSLIEVYGVRDKIPTLNLATILRPNIVADSVLTERFRREDEQRALAPVGVISQNEIIVSRGEKITPQIFTNIATCQQMIAERGDALEHTAHSYPRLGSFMIIALLMLVLFAYLGQYRPKLYSDLRTMLFISLMVVGFTVFAFVLSSMFGRGIYVVPFTIIPIVMVVFLDSRTAFVAYLVTVLLVASMTHFMWDFIVMQFIAGFVALASISELSKRSQLIRTAVLVFLAYSITYISSEIMQTAAIDHLRPRMFMVLGVNAVLISFAYILIFVVEKLFGFISRVTLVELSDINNPLLRELSEECPGTFQHSMAVSNIAAAAASRVGANVQLVRAGALYHDIGKMGNPAFFTENQHGVNPHDVLTPLQSARIVIGHVTEGVRRAEKAKLPARVRDFILEHHGRGKARFFYTTYCNAHPDEEVDPSPFTYPGPNPQSLETSILMMADAVEAASRSLKDHSAESINQLVSRIIDQQVQEGLHNDSPISFRNISEIKKSFAASLRTMYHSRISYPESNRPASSGAAEQAK